MAEERDWVIDKINDFIDEVINVFNVEELNYLFKELASANTSLCEYAKECTTKSKVIKYHLMIE